MKNNPKTTIVVVLLLFMGSGIIVYAATNQRNNTYTIHSSAAETTSLSPSPAMYPVVLAPKEETTMQPSPDGKKKLVMKTTRINDQLNEYTLLTMDKDESNKKLFFTERLLGQEFRIPFNTWSPDNKYFFIEKGSDALVYKESGENITPSGQFIDIKEVFSQTERSDQYKITTGWASPTLLIVNTVTKDGNNGNSYWFEVPSKVIIQLFGQWE